jgi:hypothetical protein
VLILNAYDVGNIAVYAAGKYSYFTCTSLYTKGIKIPANYRVRKFTVSFEKKVFWGAGAEGGGG